MSELRDSLPFSLEGEVAVITGGGTGLGKAMAACMCAAGATVVITGRREEPLRETVAELGDRARYYVFDVTEVDSCPNLIARISDEVGVPKILVNNAGVHLKKTAIETGDDEFSRVLQTHLNGALGMTRAVVPGMIDAGGGSVLFISSMTAYMGMPLVVAYSAAKSAVKGMVYTLSAELAPKGIRVNALAPGWIDTEMVRKALGGDEERRRKVMGRIQNGKLGKPEDIGWAAVYLSSPAASYITGLVMPVDGGGHVGF
ncbi:MAG: SDR family NAD(P)-dependent oxidoreductase [Verrucomicrobiales bacterium]|nr:SDR family NAD(P)-dependent oxidoreductase [Verrucomicrobiales bacterium]